MKLEKPEKLLANLYDKIEYVIHMQTWNHGLTWLKPQIDVNTKLRQ